MALPKSPPWADGDVWNAAAVNDLENRVGTAIAAATPSMVEVQNTVATAGTAQTIPDPATAGNATINYLTLTSGTCTVTMPAPTPGASFLIAYQQGGSGSYTVAYAGTAIHWPGNTQPALTTTVGKIDIHTFLAVSSTAWLGAAGPGNL